ncbi:hypothetical protein K2173_028267 [Erythroxylum novogranatense]|uniref:SPARK domain-containing protein n=1 Tax=Erythroxylum novogranatense TaxID=1862640 RepID=A0AAV8U409_9ROSI|nr:hypothetical protein K2173_028267 [Erythroxylum novogranatense]
MLPNNIFIFFFFFFHPFISFCVVLGLPHLDPANVQTLQPFLPTPSASATIPAFPEQSNVASCQLDLPDELFHGIKAACGSGNGGDGQLRKTRCCPVLAAWLYYAYSSTTIGMAGRVVPAAVAEGVPPSYEDMPLLPDDSETCVDTLGKELKRKGMELFKPNETCDLVYCYCGIRLHPLSCPEAFSLNQKGKLVGDKTVERLERDCLSSSSDVNGFTGLGGCSKCLNSLSLLHNKSSDNHNKSLNSSKSADRTTKMRNKDCQLMGLTWLLAKNRTAYIQTVSNVLRAMMLTSDPHSCALNTDGMPLAVDSSEINNSSCSVTAQLASILVLVTLICFSHIMLLLV